MTQGTPPTRRVVKNPIKVSLLESTKHHSGVYEKCTHDWMVNNASGSLDGTWYVEVYCGRCGQIHDLDFFGMDSVTPYFPFLEEEGPVEMCTLCECEKDNCCCSVCPSCDHIEEDSGEGDECEFCCEGESE